MNQTFKVGDKVYFPLKGNKIYTLKQSKNKTYPLMIERDPEDSHFSNFTKKGIYYIDHKNASIFHATKENKELLSSLYGVQFEEPKSFLDHHLSLGSKVLCLICQNKEHNLPNKIWKINKDNQFIDIIIDKQKNTYIASHEVSIKWDYIYPISVDEKGNITYLE